MDIPYGNIVTAVITTATTLAAVVVTNWLSYWRSNRERLWELRREIYGMILSELAAVEHICDGIDEAVAERGYEEYWNTKSRQRDDVNISERMGTIRKNVSDNYLSLITFMSSGCRCSISLGGYQSGHSCLSGMVAMPDQK
jgi:hypothetical protein